MPPVIDLTTSDSDDSHSRSEEDGRSGTVSSNGAETATQHTSDLTQAIQSVSEKRLRRIITNLVSTVPDARHFLEQELLITIDINGASAARRTAVRWETCEKCGEEFEMGEGREDGECIYHPGEMEPDFLKGFVDWDEDCHGEINSEEVRKEYPQKYTWTCCEEAGTAGCVRESHAPARARKRARH